MRQCPLHLQSTPNFGSAANRRGVPIPVSVRTLFHQHGVEFGKYGRQLGLIGEAVQPGNEAIKPWRQENQIAARLSLSAEKVLPARQVVSMSGDGGFGLAQAGERNHKIAQALLGGGKHIYSRHH